MRLIRPADLGRLIIVGLAFILTVSVSLRALDWLPLTLPFLVVGTILAVRRPMNPIGWLLLGLICALALATEPIDTTPAAIADGTAPLAATALAVVSASVAGPMIFVILQVLTLVLPAGTFPTGTWGRRARIAFTVEGIVIVLTAFSPTMGGINFVGIEGQVSGVTNPLAIAPEAAFWGPLVVASYLVGIGVLLVGAVSIVARARRSSGIERLQFRWIVSALVLVTAALLLAMTTGQFILAGVSITLIPISIGIAVLRYRLYDIDRLVSRTISYLIVTGVLAIVFVGAVLGFGHCSRRSSARIRWRSRHPRWSWPHSSSPCDPGSSGSSTGASTGPATTLSRPSTRSRPGSGTRSTSAGSGANSRPRSRRLSGRRPPVSGRARRIRARADGSPASRTARSPLHELPDLGFERAGSASDLGEKATARLRCSIASSGRSVDVEQVGQVVLERRLAVTVALSLATFEGIPGQLDRPLCGRPRSATTRASVLRAAIRTPGSATVPGAARASVSAASTTAIARSRSARAVARSPRVAGQDPEQVERTGNNRRVAGRFGQSERLRGASRSEPGWVTHRRRSRPGRRGCASAAHRRVPGPEVEGRDEATSARSQSPRRAWTSPMSVFQGRLPGRVRPGPTQRRGGRGPPRSRRAASGSRREPRGGPRQLDDRAPAPPRDARVPHRWRRLIGASSPARRCASAAASVRPARVSWKAMSDQRARPSRAGPAEPASAEATRAWSNRRRVRLRL